MRLHAGRCYALRYMPNNGPVKAEKMIGKRSEELIEVCISSNNIGVLDSCENLRGTRRRRRRRRRLQTECFNTRVMSLATNKPTRQSSAAAKRE